MDGNEGDWRQEGRIIEFHIGKIETTNTFSGQIIAQANGDGTITNHLSVQASNEIQPHEVDVTSKVTALRLKIQTPAGSTPQLSVVGPTGKTCAIEEITIEGAVLRTSEATLVGESWSDPNPENSTTRFYRAKLLGP